MKKVITPTEQLALQGLVALADILQDQLTQIEKAAYAILEMEVDHGHVSDMIFNETPVRRALSYLGVTVEEEATVEEATGEAEP